MLIKIIFICVILKYTTAQDPQKEYKLEYSFKANWYEANLFCRDHGMQLATINSQNEGQRIHELILTNGPRDSDLDLDLSKEKFWISGTDLAKTGRLMWFSTGRYPSYLSYMDWGIEWVEPPQNEENPEEVKQDTGKHCVRIGYSTTWTMDSCDTLYYFVCEPIV